MSVFSLNYAVFITVLGSHFIIHPTKILFVEMILLFTVFTMLIIRILQTHNDNPISALFFSVYSLTVCSSHLAGITIRI